MKLHDICNKMEHCLALASKSNPLLNQYKLAITDKVSQMGIVPDLLLVAYNIDFFMVNPVTDVEIIEGMLQAHTIYVSAMYPEELRAVSSNAVN